MVDSLFLDEALALDEIMTRMRRKTRRLLMLLMRVKRVTFRNSSMFPKQQCAIVSKPSAPQA